MFTPKNSKFKIRRAQMPSQWSSTSVYIKSSEHLPKLAKNCNNINDNKVIIHSYKDLKNV